MKCGYGHCLNDTERGKSMYSKRNPHHCHFCVPKIPHEMGWHRTRAFMVRGRRVTTQQLRYSSTSCNFSFVYEGNSFCVTVSSSYFIFSNYFPKIVPFVIIMFKNMIQLDMPQMII